MVTLGPRSPSRRRNDGNAFTPFWTRVIAPIVAAEMLLAVFIVANGLQTVTQVWLGVVLLARFVAIVTGAELSSGRYSFGWYAARVEELVAAVVVLAIFLAKINDLMLRLAARSRSTAEALEVGEARYASLANVVPQLIWTTNASGDFEYVNDRWVAYTGFDLNASREARLAHARSIPIRRPRFASAGGRACARASRSRRSTACASARRAATAGSSPTRCRCAAGATRWSRGSARAPTSTRRSGSRSARRSSRARASGSARRSTSRRRSRR